MMQMHGRVIKQGRAQGKALVSNEPISFFGCIDPSSGVVTEKGHVLEGKSIKDTILVFPYSKGSTVGSYALYRLKKRGCAPKGIINIECEAIVAVGSIISDIPCVDGLDIDKIKTGDYVTIDSDQVTLEKK